MPRTPRTKGNGIHYHVILRCNNKEKLLQGDEDFRQVLHFLSVTKKEFWFRLYNYELLHAHIHLTLSTHNDYYIDQAMHDFCFKFAKDYNLRHNRSGHFWAHRYHSRIILNDRHGLACLRYQHRNAFSANIVSRPEEWPWSGYHHYALGIPNDLLDLHPSYLALGEDNDWRQRVYRKFVYTPLPSDKHKLLFEGRCNVSSQRFQRMLKQVGRTLEHSTRSLAPGDEL